MTLLASGCGSSSNSADLSLPLPTNEVAPEPSDTTEATKAASSESTSATETDAPDEGAGEFEAKTVRFDPDNPPSQSELEDLVFAAVEADFSNLLWCWENADTCDVARDLGPAIAEPREIEIKQAHSQFIADGALYTRSEIDAVYRAEVLATTDGEFEFGVDNNFRLLGAVSTCEVFAGPYFIPAKDGQPEQVVDDEALSYMAEYRVWQGLDGVLRVASRLFNEQGAVEDCDSLKD
jgi:hypothetical protein